MAKRQDTQSVTNATLDLKLGTLTDTVRQLSDTVNVGFKGVHERQDLTNGKVLKAADDIKTLQAKFEYNRLIWYMLTTCISLIVALISFILFKP